jgi:hypothetical protein
MLVDSVTVSSVFVESIGIDIDGTITLDPMFFAQLSRGIRERGGYVHVVSSRSREGRRETLIELVEYGISFDELYLLPSIEDAQDLCPHQSLNWFDRHCWLKIDYAKRNGLTFFVDDDQRILELFKTYAPEIKAIPVSARQKLSVFL